ncbi:MAG: hypothetical protein JWQ43_2950 [Glaciihabitans sp.]|nr:hypothetical protein [Glaciihabitans sp.]
MPFNLFSLLSRKKKVAEPQIVSSGPTAPRSLLTAVPEMPAHAAMAASEFVAPAEPSADAKRGTSKPAANKTAATKPANRPASKPDSKPAAKPVRTTTAAGVGGPASVVTATVPELRMRAKELGLTGYSKLNKAALIAALEKHTTS